MKLRKWVKVVLMLISIMSLLVLGGDSENMFEFIIGHIIALGLFALSTGILLRGINE